MKAAYFCIFRLQQLVLTLDKFAEMRLFFLKGNVFRLDDGVFRLDELAIVTLFLLHDGVFVLHLRRQLRDPQLRLHQLFPYTTRLLHPLNSQRLRFRMRPEQSRLILHSSAALVKPTTQRTPRARLFPPPLPNDHLHLDHRSHQTLASVKPCFNPRPSQYQCKTIGHGNGLLPMRQAVPSQGTRAASGSSGRQEREFNDKCRKARNPYLPSNDSGQVVLEHFTLS